MRRLSILLLTLAALRSPDVARAQDSCACARSVCETMRAGQHRSSSSCENMASLPASACTATAQDLVSRMRATGRAAPAACNGIVAPVVIEGAVPEAPSNTGPMISPAPVPAAPPADRAPTPIAADPPRRVASAGGRLACELEHDARRVVVAGAPVTFAVRCAGIPMPTAPRGSTALVPPPARTADGRTVDVTWSTTSGVLAPERLFATWRAPMTAPQTGDVQVRATVTLADANGHSSESVVLTRTVHVVPRTLTLEVSSHVAARCDAASDPRASAYDVDCHATIGLEVGDDLSVRGRGSTPCTAPVVTNARACGGGGGAVATPSGFAITSASGRIDPDTGILTLDVDGRPTRPSQPVAGSRRAAARAARRADTTRRSAGPLPRALRLAPENGAVRSFGSFDPSSGAGERATFTLRASH